MPQGVYRRPHARQKQQRVVCLLGRSHDAGGCRRRCVPIGSLCTRHTHAHARTHTQTHHYVKTPVAWFAHRPCVTRTQRTGDESSASNVRSRSATFSSTWAPTSGPMALWMAATTTD